MNYLLNTHDLQYCELAFSLYKNWYDFNEIDTGNNTLPIYKEIRETYERLPSNEWLMKYESMFIKTFENMIMPVDHDDKIWLYKNIKPNETRMYGLDIEGIAAVTAIEVRTWKFIIDNLPFYEKYLFTETPFSNFDTNDTTNPLIFNVDLITGLHNNFRSYIFETTDIDNFKDYFRKTPKKINKRDGITIAELCYFFGKIEHLQTGVSNFALWMQYHIGNNNYGTKKNELIEMEKTAKDKRNSFSLTVKQEKALANKLKIENLFNGMHLIV